MRPTLILFSEKDCRHLHKSTYNLRAVPTNTEIFYARFMAMQEKQILARAIGIQKENWG